MTHAQQKDMANRMKQRRESLGYTQEQFCEIIDISASSYTKIENAFQKPSLDTLILIAQHLSLSLDYLVFGTEEMNPLPLTQAEKIFLLANQLDPSHLKEAGDFLLQLSKMDI